MGHPDYQQCGSVEVRVIEECAELIQAIAKCQRFGWDNWHPDRPERKNADDVLSEIVDVERCCVELREKIEREKRDEKS